MVDAACKRSPKKFSIQMIALIVPSRLIAMKEHQPKRKEQK
jgi:hypothetical protein